MSANITTLAFIRVFPRIILVWVPLLVALLPGVGHGSAAARAGVVIRYADGTVTTSCVTFEAASISGLELLQRATPEVIAQAAPGNAAICKIGADGCDYPAEPCFCTFGAGNSGEYWAYWQLDGRTWRYGAQGAGARQVLDGDVDGWSYGSGSAERAVQPPVVTFEEVCPLASASIVEASGPATALGVAPSELAASLAPTAPVQSGAAGGAAQPGVAASAPAAVAAPPDGGWAGYLAFGAMLAAVLGAIAVAVRRRAS